MVLLDVSRFLGEIVSMSNTNRENTLSTPRTRSNTLLKNVYLWMTAGLVLTAIVAYFIGGNSALVYRMYTTGLIYPMIIGQFVIVLILSRRLERMTARTAMVCFGIYSVCTGAILSSVVVIYTGAVISRAFFTTALMFGGMSLYAMRTKRDLSRIGSVLVMGLWGLIISSVINLFFKSEPLYYLISIIGVVLFSAITAWDTQKIMRLNESYGYDIDDESFIKLSIICALELYLDFINIFLYLLRLFGRSNRN